ncbi:MAG: hypothetical protein A2622_13265 [Bdellovibrionales bacterium RIFCSPHIGHO2_01_FULL_40_29]|nr:MAG: hypothetical protein A2622_13265 [Bdellovibrionales bacterium RIFCSPHIGHO2_01_FULL_40_29]OFZ33342.1 MAG: hypothetical protein A3D17_13620 [Bdellovibrionales bacterium RIFCSPHIGHO2_02_FULL_40_15]
MFAKKARLVLNFPNPREPTNEGVIGIGGTLTVDNLVQAYDHGIFPWPHDGYPLLWFCPDERGVIDFADVHPPKSFLKWYRKHRSEFVITQNTCFRDVIRNCKEQVRPGQQGTWINSKMQRAYNEMHLSGYAMSLEVWQNGVLVGGIYAVQSQKYVSCESMFFKVSNASKLALYELIQVLKSWGHTWMDIQMVTSVCESFGGKLIHKDEFLDRINVE